MHLPYAPPRCDTDVVDAVRRPMLANRLSSSSRPADAGLGPGVGARLTGNARRDRGITGQRLIVELKGIGGAPDIGPAPFTVKVTVPSAFVVGVELPIAPTEPTSVLVQLGRSAGRGCREMGSSKIWDCTRGASGNGEEDAKQTEFASGLSCGSHASADRERLCRGHMPVRLLRGSR